MTISEIIEKSLGELNEFIKTTKWQGRENEVVNLYAHSFLSKYVGTSPLISLSQIGIEVAVKQIGTEKGKKLVRKDLVIWNEENGTVWDEKFNTVHNPLSVLEWKVNHEVKSGYDIEWLRNFTAIFPEVIGYSICVFIDRNRGLVFNKISKGQIEERQTQHL